LISESACKHALFAPLPLRLQLVAEGVAFPHFKSGRNSYDFRRKLQNTRYRVQSTWSSIDIPAERSIELSIMALNWEALADEIDYDNSQATEARLVAFFAGLFRPLAA
jgi:hypothetical protein